MAELEWLDGYSGQTVGQLIAMDGTHRIDSLILAFEQALDQKAARDGDDSLTREEKTILAVEALEREVNNGGFDQFFVNSSVEYAPIIVGILHQIGCPIVAAITERAIEALRVPNVTVAAINDVYRDDDARRDETLDECDRQFLEYPDNIEAQLFSYISDNKSRIHF